MRIHYPDGSAQEGAILSLVGGVMRVAVQDCDDPLELNLVNGMWLSDACEPVYFDFPLGGRQAEGFPVLIQEASPAAQGLWN